jgi:hypothetical protein
VSAASIQSSGRRSRYLARSGRVPNVKLFFLGLDGKRITLADLPPRNLKRFLPQHKAMVVAAVRHGLITLDTACKRYELSTEDYLSWYRVSQRKISSRVPRPPRR